MSTETATAPSGKAYPWVTVRTAEFQKEKAEGGQVHLKGWLSRFSGRPQVAIVLVKNVHARPDADDLYRVFLHNQPAGEREPVVKSEAEMVQVGKLGLRRAKGSGRPYLFGPVLTGWAKVLYTPRPREGHAPYFMTISEQAWDVQGVGPSAPDTAGLDAFLGDGEPPPSRLRILGPDGQPAEVPA